MHYTPAQTRWFLAAIDRADAERLRTDTLAARMVQADAKALKAWLDMLARE